LDEALIVVAVVSGLFTLAGIQLLNHNWFKKEIFKANTLQTKKVNDLKIKKLSREMGLSPMKNAALNTGTLLDTAKQLKPLLNLISGSNGGELPLDEEEGEEEDSGVNDLINFVRKNPDMVKGFLSKMPQQLTGGGGENESGWL